MTDNAPSTPRRRRRIANLATIAVMVIPVAILVYEVATLITGGSLSVMPVRIVPIDMSGETLGDFTFSFPDHPTAIPDLAFVDGDQKALSLTDFRGRAVLLNVWATWCVPCRKEMPSLDRLQAKFDPSKFLVLTLSIDPEGIPAIKKFYDELGLKSLGTYLDPSIAASNKLRLPGVPGTLLIDAQGQEVGRKLGPAEWDSPETVAVLRQHLALGGAEKTGASP